MSETTLHTFASTGTILTAVVIGVGIWFVDELAGNATALANPYDKMVVIDAALAEKSSAQEKQPQKDFRAPPPPDKPVGVSRDENAKPVVKPDKPPPDPKINVDDVLAKNRKDDDDDLPIGKPRIEIGRLDGSEVGFGDKTHGDPYLGALKSGFMRLWEYPEILSDVGLPIGCIRLEEDGSIKDTKLMQSSNNPELDDSVERALTEFQKKNNREPKLLPDHLSYLLRMPLCWRLKV